jgi:hypothetical protein
MKLCQELRAGAEPRRMSVGQWYLEDAGELDRKSSSRPLASTDVVYEEGGDAVAGARELGRQDGGERVGRIRLAANDLDLHRHLPASLLNDHFPLPRVATGEGADVDVEAHGGPL